MAAVDICVSAGHGCTCIHSRSSCGLTMQHQAQLQHEGPTLWSVPQPEVNTDFACMPSNDQAAAVAKKKSFY